jgi:hypothetical protein
MMLLRGGNSEARPVTACRIAARPCDGAPEGAGCPASYNQPALTRAPRVCAAESQHSTDDLSISFAR